MTSTRLAALLGCALLLSCATLMPPKPAAVAPVVELEEVAGGPDLVLLRDGQKIYATVISEAGPEVVLGQRTGTFSLRKKDVKEIQRGAAPDRKVGIATSSQLPSLSSTFATISRQPWAKDLRPVPATVIDVGVLRNIPYISHKAGKIEFNVYGDPDHPAGVEVGIYGANPSRETREELRAFMASLVIEPGASVVRTLSLDIAKQEQGGLTFEVAPPTAVDSYGGWWISVYDLAALEKARASEWEMNAISAPVAASTADATPTGWTASDYGSKTRPASSYSGSSSSYSSTKSKSSSGKVYVRGYYRKNGTYVRPHTRSKAKSGSRRRR